MEDQSRSGDHLRRKEGMYSEEAGDPDRILLFERSSEKKNRKQMPAIGLSIQSIDRSPTGENIALLIM